MDPQKILLNNPAVNIQTQSTRTPKNTGKNFQAVLDTETSTHTFDDDSVHSLPVFNSAPPPRILLDNPEASESYMDAISAYKKQEKQSTRAYKTTNPGNMSDLQKYKDDQLLSNPGGDHYYLEQKKVVPHPKDQESFWGRVGKDISDAFSNVKNFFQDLLFGAKIRYRDKNNQIREARRRGLVGSIVDFFKDAGSALSFGLWRPDGETEPQGFGKRIGFFFSKLKEAFVGDLIQGVSSSMVHMGEDLVFAGWNLMETIPDATIGNFEAGRKLTTALFDNGQVVLDYLTDILPSGDAWVRVHSLSLKDLKPPILYNAGLPENNPEDTRWKYVRNTPFRKTIETIGSLLTDVFSLKILGQFKWFSEERHHRN